MSQEEDLTEDTTPPPTRKALPRTHPTPTTAGAPRLSKTFRHSFSCQCLNSVQANDKHRTISQQAGSSRGNKHESRCAVRLQAPETSPCLHLRQKKTCLCPTHRGLYFSYIETHPKHNFQNTAIQPLCQAINYKFPCDLEGVKSQTCCAAPCDRCHFRHLCESCCVTESCKSARPRRPRCGHFGLSPATPPAGSWSWLCRHTSLLRFTRTSNMHLDTNPPVPLSAEQQSTANRISAHPTASSQAAPPSSLLLSSPRSSQRKSTPIGYVKQARQQIGKSDASLSLCNTPSGTQPKHCPTSISYFGSQALTSVGERRHTQQVEQLGLTHSFCAP